MAYLSDFVNSSNGVFSVKTVANVATGDVVALTDLGVRPIHPYWTLVEGTAANAIFLNYAAMSNTSAGQQVINQSANVAQYSALGYLANSSAQGQYIYSGLDVITTSSVTLANGVSFVTTINSSAIAVTSVGADNLQIGSSTISAITGAATYTAVSQIVQLSSNTIAVAYCGVSGANVVVKTYTTDLQPLATINTAVGTSSPWFTGYPFALTANTTSGTWALFGKAAAGTTNAAVVIGNSSAVVATNTGIATSSGIVSSNSVVGVPCLNGDFAFATTDLTNVWISRHTNTGAPVFTANVGAIGQTYVNGGNKQWMIEYSNTFVLMPNSNTCVVCNSATGSQITTFVLPNTPLAAAVYGANLYITGSNTTSTANIYLSCVNTSFVPTTLTNQLFPITPYNSTSVYKNTNAMFLAVTGTGATIGTTVDDYYYDGTNYYYHGYFVLMQANTLNGQLMSSNGVMSTNNAPTSYLGTNYWNYTTSPCLNNTVNGSYRQRGAAAISKSPDGSFISMFTYSATGSGPSSPIFPFTWKPLKSGVFGSATTSNTAGGNVSVQTTGSFSTPNITLIRSGQFDHTNNGVAGNKGVMSQGFGYLKGLV